MVLAHGVATQRLDTGELFAEQPYTYSLLTLKGATTLVVNESGDPIVTVHRSGMGRVMVCAADYWMTDALTYRNPKLVNMEPPYALLNGVRAILDGYFGSFSPVEIQPAGLNVRICCYDGEPGRPLVGLTNNDLFADWEGTLRLRKGEIVYARDLWSGQDLGAGEAVALKVPAGDVAMVEVRMK